MLELYKQAEIKLERDYPGQLSVMLTLSKGSIVEAADYLQSFHRLAVTYIGKDDLLFTANLTEVRSAIAGLQQSSDRLAKGLKSSFSQEIEGWVGGNLQETPVPNVPEETLLLIDGEPPIDDDVVIPIRPPVGVDKNLPSIGGPRSPLKKNDNVVLMVLIATVIIILIIGFKK